MAQLPKNEVEELVDYVSANHTDELHTLFQLIREYQNKGNHLGREECFRHCFGEKTRYDDKKLRYLTSEGLAVLHRFVINGQIKRDPHLYNLLLLKGLKHLGIDDELRRISNNALKKIEKEPHQNAKFHYYKYQFLKQAIQIQFGDKRRGALNLDDLHTSLSDFYKTEYELSQLTTLTYQVHNPGGVSDPKPREEAQSTVIYRLLKELLISSDSKQYFNIKPLIKRLSIFPPQEHREVLLHLINYCIKQINRQKKEYIEECYDWYMWGLEAGILLDKGYISKYTFKNIITLCLKSEEKNKAEIALDELAVYLPVSKAQKIIDYNRARIHFTNNDYPQSMDLLRNIEYDDLLDELDGRRMLMRIYFETKEWLALDSFLISFEAFIRRQKSLGYHKDFYLNLVKYVKRAMNQHRMKPTTRQKLIENIMANPQVNDKKWLLSILQ